MAEPNAFVRVKHDGGIVWITYPGTPGLSVDLGAFYGAQYKRYPPDMKRMIFRLLDQAGRKILEVPVARSESDRINQLFIEGMTREGLRNDDECTFLVQTTWNLE